MTDRIVSPEAFQLAKKLVNDFVPPGMSRRTLPVARLLLLATLAINDAIQAERWACHRATNPAHWIYHIPPGEYLHGFVDGLRAAHERISARLETDPSNSPDDPLNSPDPSNSPDPLLKEAP